MSSRKLRLTLVALSTAVVLLAGPALSQAGGFGRFSGAQPADHPAPSIYLSTVWSFFQSLWGEEGASLDPDGLRSTSAPEGGSLDPDGHHLTGSTAGDPSLAGTGDYAGQEARATP